MRFPKVSFDWLILIWKPEKKRARAKPPPPPRYASDVIDGRATHAVDLHPPLGVHLGGCAVQLLWRKEPTDVDLFRGQRVAFHLYGQVVHATVKSDECHVDPRSVHSAAQRALAASLVFELWRLTRTWPCTTSTPRCSA